MVRELFAPLASQVKSEDVVNIHPVLRPEPLHSTGDLIVRLAQHPFSERAGLRFRFEQQTCATSFSFSYAIRSEETTQ